MQTGTTPTGEGEGTHRLPERPSAALAAMTANARAEFGVRCFWNAPHLADPIEDARLVASRLRKYGGRRGWATAIEIERVLREAAGASDGVDPVPARGAEASRA